MSTLTAQLHESKKAYKLRINKVIKEKLRIILLLARFESFYKCYQLINEIYCKNPVGLC